MKQKLTHQSGFTLIEMLFVTAILAMMYGLMLINISAWRGPQSLKQAQRELVTQLQKVRSYSLSSRTIAGNTAKFYMVKFSTSSPRSYVIQGIASTDGGDVVFDGGVGNQPNLETINFPGNVQIAQMKLWQPAGTAQVDPTCVQVSASLPYGQIFIDATCNFPTTAELASTLSQKANSVLEIYLNRVDETGTLKKITINGVSSRIEQD